MTGQPFERVQDALRFVPAEDRDTWLRIGMAVKSELGEEGFDLWDSWSQQADSYKPQDAKSVWRSIRPNGHVTGGTLFYEAKANGWNGSGVNGFASREEIEERKRKAAEAASKDEAERKARRSAAADKARRLWKEAKPVSDHPYLIRKGVAPTDTLREIPLADALPVLGYAPQASGEPLQGRLLIVPAMADGKIATVEMIDEGGRKTALADGRKSGGYWATSPLPESDEGATLLIGEGVATVLSASQATGYTGLAALSCGNLAAVASAMRERFPKARLIVLSDIGNGEEAARRAADSARACLAVPEFGPNRPEGAKDFNDMHGLAGAEAVRGTLEAAAIPEPSKAPENAPRAVSGDEWPELMPLIAETQSQPYPIDALPGVIGEAVREVVGFVQCPDALAACSALSAVSLATQGLADVRRDEGLSGPSSLYLLAIAESGERKTTCDGHFLTPIRDWEAEQLEAKKPEIAKHAAAMRAWEARRKGLLSKIEELSKKNQSSDREERDLAEMDGDKPKAPKVPRVVFGDATPEALAWMLASGWPSAGVLSSEAGIVFGGHGMKSDSVMRNLSLLNVLWEGGAQAVDRKQSECFILRGARLTMGLAVQPETVRTFLEATKGLARGSGFAARFLIAWPESTQGTRLYRKAPATWPNLSAFRRRISDLLGEPLNQSEAGELAPLMLDLTPEAKAAWVAFHDDVEGELRPGGDMEQARDVASKAADNAARLAALFHVFEHGPYGAIGEEHLRAGARIAAWHLYEARRFLGTLALPRVAINAGRLETWLLRRCREAGAGSVSTRDVRQFGPGALRDHKALSEAIAELAEAGRARLIEAGRKRRIYPNPALLAEGNHGA